MFPMVPIFDALQQKNIWSHLTFLGVRGRVEQKMWFWRFVWQIGYGCCPLTKKSQMEKPKFSKIVNGYVFDFTKLHEELLFK